MNSSERINKIKKEVSFDGWLVGYLEKEDFEWLISEVEKLQNAYQEGFEDGHQDMWGQIYDPNYKSK